MTPGPLVPLFDIRISGEEIERVTETLRSGWLTMGPRTEAFEEHFARHLGVQHAVALASGTAALHLAYLAVGVGPGDEVIVPATTFVASAAAVRYCGADPVLADCLAPGDLGIDPADVERRITARTRAVCIVHYAGYAADTAALELLCDEHGLALIEDAAHAPSATDAAGRKLGTIGQAGCFSFFSNKVLSCGEGGLLATNDDEVAVLARSLRAHGLSSGTWDRHRGHAPGYDVVATGFNYRIDEPRSALLDARLQGLEGDITARRALVARYRALLSGLRGVSIPYSDEDVQRSSCYVMPVMLSEPDQRERVRAIMLDEHGVQTSVLYPAIQSLSAYADLDTDDLPASVLVGRGELTLPLYPHLTHADQDQVATALAAALSETSASV